MAEVVLVPWIRRESYEEMVLAGARTKTLEELLSITRGQVRELKDEVALLRARADHEQNRADVSLHMLATTKSGIAVPAPATDRPSEADVIDPHEEVEEEVLNLRKEIEEKGILSVLEKYRNAG